MKQQIERRRADAGHGFPTRTAALSLTLALGGCGGGGQDPAPSSANLVPTVSLASAATGTVGTTIALTATAADGDDGLAKVEFFDGTTLLGSDTASPYTFSWTPASVGAHSLSARATDTRGAATTSATVTVTIAATSTGDLAAPTATLLAPANFASGLAGTVTLTADATDNVRVASVEFQIDGATLVTDTTAPYTTTLATSAYTSGQHVLRARATDGAGNVSPWASATVQFGGTVTQPAGFTRNEAWVTGLTNATAIAQAPDGRLFVAQQNGALRVVKAGVLLATPFTTVPVDSTGERGLIGVALHPDFATNNHVYVYATRTAGGVAHNRVSRYTAIGDIAVSNSEATVLDLPDLSAATNHNGGGMHFGIDRKLYVGVGENANRALASDLSSPLGKLLRVNDDGSIPADNPYATTQTGLARAIWASGLRNPYTFAVEPVSGRIYVNDVGENTWEEINLGAKGANYGWPSSEGPDGVTSTVTAPLFAYKHTDASPLGSGPGGFLTGSAIAGGSFYPTAGTFPTGYREQYYFADYVSKFVARYDSGNGAAYSFAALTGSPVDLLVGIDGAVYVLTRSAITRITAP